MTIPIYDFVDHKSKDIMQSEINKLISLMPDGKFSVAEFHLINLVQMLTKEVSDLRSEILELKTQKVSAKQEESQEPFVEDAVAFIKLVNNNYLRRFLKEYVILNPVSSNSTEIIMTHEHSFGQFVSECSIEDTVRMASPPGEFKNTRYHTGVNYIRGNLNKGAQIYHKKQIPALC